MSISFLCKLWHGNKVLDENSTCTFSWIRKNPDTGVIEGEGTLTILTLMPFELRGKEIRQFILSFDAAFVVGLGKLDKIPILLVPDDLVGKATTAFRVGTL
jgi:hypothetical protein